MSTRRRAVAVSGFKSSGKTTLLAALIPKLRRRGLSVAAVKRDVHGVRVDAEGSDSDRLFGAGADVVLRGPEQLLERRHRRPAEEDDLESTVRRLTLRHDLVLVEGGKSTRLPKLWLGRTDSEEPPEDVPSVLETLPPSSERERRALARITELLEESWSESPLAAGVLAGGSSRRMGRPKEDLEVGGDALLERTGRVLAAVADPVIRLGGTGGSLTTLPDPPDRAGPLAGMVAACRWLPFRTWIFAACDMPRIRGEALGWLLGRRSPGRWGVLPTVNGVVQPLLAVYEPMVGPALERLAGSNAPSPSRLGDLSRIVTPEPPDPLVDAWEGANTPEEWERLRPSS